MMLLLQTLVKLQLVGRKGKSLNCINLYVSKHYNIVRKESFNCMILILLLIQQHEAKEYDLIRVDGKLI